MDSILCLNDCRGNLSQINVLVEKHNSLAVFHTGSFGIFTQASLKNLQKRHLDQLVEVCPLYSPYQKKSILAKDPQSVLNFVKENPLSEFEDFLNGTKKFHVPVYLTWGAKEDLQLVRLMLGNKISIPNLHLIAPNQSPRITLGDLKIDVFSLGGQLNYERIFDFGSGDDRCSGGSFPHSLWMNIVQISQLLEHATKITSSRTEAVRILLTMESPGQEDIINLIARQLKAHFCISSNRHFRYTCIHSDYSTHNLASFTLRINKTVADLEYSINQVVQRFPNISESDKSLMLSALSLLKAQAESIRTESDLRGCVTLAQVDAEEGYLLLRYNKTSHIGTEVYNRGFHFRRTTQEAPPQHFEPLIADSPTSRGDQPETISSESSFSTSTRASETACQNFKGSLIAIVSNLPYFRSIEQVKTALFAKYNIKSISFYNRFNDSVRVEAADEETVLALKAELDGVCFNGSALRVSRVSPGASI